MLYCCMLLYAVLLYCYMLLCTYYLGFGPGFSPPLPLMRLSFLVPLLGVFFEGAFPLPSAIRNGPLSELLSSCVPRNAGLSPIAQIAQDSNGQ
jgi:hypothetical protein